MRLLKLPESVQDLLKAGTISAGHARALLSLDEPEAMARKIVSEGLTVRDVENLQQKNTASPKKQKNSTPKEKDADTRALERALIDVLGMKVEISHLGEAGSVTVHYSSLEQLDALCQRLKS
jgi:ParB family chromosome partitioning protein